MVFDIFQSDMLKMIFVTRVSTHKLYISNIITYLKEVIKKYIIYSCFFIGKYENVN